MQECIANGTILHVENPESQKRFPSDLRILQNFVLSHEVLFLHLQSCTNWGRYEYFLKTVGRGGRGRLMLLKLKI